MDKKELTELVLKSKDGDMDAMEKLLVYAHTSVSYQCRNMLKNEQDAEDMTQEVLVLVYQKLDTLQEPAAFHLWLKKITASRCINALTRTHKELQFAEDEEGHSVLDSLEELDESKVPDKWLDNTETTRMIAEIVESLPDAQRASTLMFYYSEMSVKEISDAMGVSENTVKSRLNYARKAIKDKVQEYEKQGIKLYGLSPLPFLFFFLRQAAKDSAKPAAAKVMVKEILAEDALAAMGAFGASASASAGSAAAGTAAGTATASVAGSAASGGLAALISAIPVKVVVGITAAVIAVGSISAVAITAENKKELRDNAPVVSEAPSQGEDQLYYPEDEGEDAAPVDDEHPDATEETEVTEPEITEPGAEETVVPETDGSTGPETVETPAATDPITEPLTCLEGGDHSWSVQRIVDHSTIVEKTSCVYCGAYYETEYENTCLHYTTELIEVMEDGLGRFLCTSCGASDIYGACGVGDTFGHCSICGFYDMGIVDLCYYCENGLCSSCGQPLSEGHECGY